MVAKAAAQGAAAQVVAAMELAKTAAEMAVVGKERAAEERARVAEAEAQAKVVVVRVAA